MLGNFNRHGAERSYLRGSEEHAWETAKLAVSKGRRIFGPDAACGKISTSSASCGRLHGSAAPEFWLHHRAHVPFALREEQGSSRPTFESSKTFAKLIPGDFRNRFESTSPVVVFTIVASPAHAQSRYRVVSISDSR